MTRAGLGFVVCGFSGCGWRPVHSPPGSAVAVALQSVDIAIIPERQGQLLRQALQARLSGDGADIAPVYVLQTNYVVQSEGLAITGDSSVTRIRLVATSNFVLRPLAEMSRTCTSGATRQVDGYDVENQQFFAADLEAETAQRRLADATANDIATRLAVASGRVGGFGCEVR